MQQQTQKWQASCCSLVSFYALGWWDSETVYNHVQSKQTVLIKKKKYRKRTSNIHLVIGKRNGYKISPSYFLLSIERG